MTDDGRFAAYAGLSTPSVIIDADYRLVYLNPSAERFWGVRLGEVAGQYPVPALRLASPDGREVQQWVTDIVFPALAEGDPFTCRVAGPPERVVRLTGTRFFQDGAWYCMVTVDTDGDPQRTPSWALTDALTGLSNRHRWDREFPDRNRRHGCVIFLDVDALKQINDLHGHRQGDAVLRAVGAAVREVVPTDALAVRYGGDEFVVVVDDREEEFGRALAERIVSRVTQPPAGWPEGVHVDLGYGVAAYGPGGLPAAIQSADEALYEQKGVLLRGAGGGRIILTSEGRGRVSSPGSEAPGHGEFGRGFGSQFDAYFRQAYARAAEQAREFVDFVAPEPGSVVVEVGAGAGRISFDGGLAARIGDSGQLLLTDPSTAQIQVARQRAESLGLSWVRFLPAPVEALPVASNTVDLVLGAAFLHYTDAGTAIRSMARVVRPGGRVALFAGLGSEYGPATQRAMQPVRQALELHGLPFRDLFLPQEALEALFADAGLTIERRAVSPGERVVPPNADVAVFGARQAQLVRLLLRGVPEAVHPEVEAEYEAVLRAAIAELGPGAASFTIPSISLMARKGQ